ncbi:MAG: histidinol dehydrogenase [Chitinivibrionales bacterium]|nr:histidinol dehydrogenase [Chitinivibrionales bacterium]
MAKQKLIPMYRYTPRTGSRIISSITGAAEKNEKHTPGAVEKILSEIREKGARAVIEYTKKFDGVSLKPSTMRLSADLLEHRAKKTPRDLKKAVKEAAQRIKAFHLPQKPRGYSLQTAEGVLCQKIRPLSRVGVYVPGGRAAYPSTVLMNVIPARIAGVKDVVAVTPPQRELHPAIAYALKLMKVTEVYQIGGAQAVGALAYGTRTIAPVEKIVGPGNRYVAQAKRCVYGTVDIDSIAGPSEVMILADQSADASWVALDLLAQAEHGSGDEIAVCVTESDRFAKKLRRCIADEIERSPRACLPGESAGGTLSIVVTGSRKESLEVINRCAPEHLQIMTVNPQHDLKGIVNASAVFLGRFTPAALGDYFIGTNHVLPTGGAARYASPLGVESFVKRISVAGASRKGLKQAAPHVSTFARAEGLVYHALSVERRALSLEKIV